MSVAPFFDLVANTRVATGLLPAIISGNGTTTDGVNVNTANAGNTGFVITVGATGETLSGSLKIDFVMQEADDNGSGAPGSWGNVAAADIQGTFPVLDANAKASQSYRVTYRGSKAWLRVRVVLTGNHTTGTALSILALASPINKPA
jgi:hypothetical protein